MPHVLPLPSHIRLYIAIIGYGKSYGACGGEAVRSIGAKHLSCVSGSGVKHKYTFQVGDRITKPLLAVSKICEQGQAVFFGPGPKYESYIISDPEAFVVANKETKTNIELINGTYHMRCFETQNKTSNSNNTPGNETLAPLSDDGGEPDAPASGEARDADDGPEPGEAEGDNAPVPIEFQETQ